MLKLSRRAGERILVGPDTWITVCAVRGNRVVLGFQTPKDTTVQLMPSQPITNGSARKLNGVGRFQQRRFGR
jgi:hypothetical protein